MQCNEFEIVEMRVFPFFEPKVALHGTKVQTTCTRARDVCWTNGRETERRDESGRYEGTTAVCCVLRSVNCTCDM